MTWKEEIKNSSPKRLKSAAFLLRNTAFISFWREIPNNKWNYTRILWQLPSIQFYRNNLHLHPAWHQASPCYRRPNSSVFILTSSFQSLIWSIGNWYCLQLLHPIAAGGAAAENQLVSSRLEIFNILHVWGSSSDLASKGGGRWKKSNAFHFF